MTIIINSHRKDKAVVLYSLISWPLSVTGWKGIRMLALPGLIKGGEHFEHERNLGVQRLLVKRSLEHFPQ